MPSTTTTHDAKPSKVDSVRERELYRYFQPSQSPTADREESSKPEHSTLSVNAASSPDTTLTALAQLCAIRLGAQRAMISVIDREKQYFIAEATRTLKISDTSKSDEDGDALWAGCSTVDKAGRLCEKTIELPIALGKAPCFTVTDLSADKRFNELPFVTGPPHFKFYAGTPLTTKRGVNIGSLFILDDTVRPCLKPEQEEFLGTIAQIVMKHMEITSEAEERKKVMRMSMGLNAFVEGQSHFHFHADSLSSDPTMEPNRDLKVGAAQAPFGTANLVQREASRARSSQRPSQDHLKTLHNESQDRHASASKTLSREGQKGPIGGSSRFGRSGASDDSEDSEVALEDLDAGPKSADSGHRATCARAATLLRESLDLDGPSRRGGVVFFDTTSRSQEQGHTSMGSIIEQGNETKPTSKPADIICQSAAEGSFSPLDEDLLLDFLRRYPRGKLWNFDVDGSLSSSEDDPVSPNERRSSEKIGENRSKRRHMEARILQHHFPRVKQLLFAGLWDAAASRWFLGGFAWTTSPRQVFSAYTELSFLRAFGNSVMAEVSRLASIAADRQKADFIGSISHEFRSPLHGILASAEFLSETNADAFQSSLVDTISSCGRTLLDTINHILDYSKINSFERTWRNVRRSGGSKRGFAHHRVVAKQEQAPPILNIYATTNVASVIEEVVEGVYAGQIYQDISSTEATDFSMKAKAKTSNQGIHVSHQTQISKASAARPVDVILDIPFEDYTFITQPGALRRIVMNIFGNALKYTQCGSIRVMLSLSPVEFTGGRAENSVQERMLQIKVTDTGKGISKEYIRTSLFSPFSQEDVLASGTGLGLSIVKSIVTMLNGAIDIQSEVGVGTQVVVTLPVSRVPGTDTSAGKSSSAPQDQSQGDSKDDSRDDSRDDSKDDSMKRLAADYPTAAIALYGFEANLKEIGRVVKRCIEDWYGLETFSGLPGRGPEHTDLVVLDETSLLDYLERRAVDVPAMVLCSAGTTQPNGPSQFSPTTVVEYVSKPFGPFKFAKGVRACLEKSQAFKHRIQPALDSSLDSEDGPVSDPDTRVPDLNPLTLETNDTRAPINIRTNGVVTAAATEKAQMALDSNFSLLPTNGDVTDTGGQDVPFPSREVAEEANEADDAAKNELFNPDERKAPNLTASNVASHNGEPASPNSSSPEPRAREKRSPRLLLVDDNKINLRLLETFVKRRRYNVVNSAENGQLAVEAVASQEQGFDIIFMDISMPVMNGFEATRAIRDVEFEAHKKHGELASPPAMIIALTGLASGRDQTEAFRSGVDLFMTKPVSFKEVGRLLDNWEQHGGLRDVRDPEADGE